MAISRISDSAVRRLSHYLRLLDEIDAAGLETISSEDLAARGDMTSAQVRKDLSQFGSFGKRGLGYPVAELRRRVTEILGLQRRWRVAIVGVGKLGAALIEYDGFRQQGFDFVAVFDNDRRKIGGRLGALKVLDVSELVDVLDAEEVDMGIIATPAAAAQEVADGLVEAGVSAILNFAPKRLRVPDHVTLRGVNLAIELEGLAFALTHAAPAKR